MFDVVAVLGNFHRSRCMVCYRENRLHLLSNISKLSQAFVVMLTRFGQRLALQIALARNNKFFSEMPKLIIGISIDRVLPTKFLHHLGRKCCRN